MIDQIHKSVHDRMQKSIDSLQHELSKVRTGRAHPSLLEHITVNYYGNETPLNQLANITVADSRTLLVTPWEKNMVPEVEKAILKSDLGLNPATAGQAIRIPMPPLTEDRRKELIKVVRHEAENARIAIRNIRRDANQQFKDLQKDKAISEDELRKAEEKVQQSTKKWTDEVDSVLAVKETDLMAI